METFKNLCDWCLGRSNDKGKWEQPFWFCDICSQATGEEFDKRRKLKEETEMEITKQQGFTMDDWKPYARKGVIELRPYVKGEDLTKISVSPEDNPETDMGMIARNPENHDDQWYVANKYYNDNYVRI